MKRINLLAALIVGLTFGPAAAADIRVAGESLDNGLGNLPASYTAAEYNRPGWVRGIRCGVRLERRGRCCDGASGNSGNAQARLR